MSSFASPSVSDGLMWAKTIPFTNQPETHEMGLTFEPGPIFNYSEYYDNLSAEEKALFMAPNELLTGDTVAINAGVRGVGSRYVVWLAADLHHNPVPKPETHLVGQTVGVKRRIEATVDVESFGLTEIQLKELRDFLKADCDDPGIFESELKAMLKDSAPGLLDQLLNDGDCVAMDAITSLRFAGDKPSLYVVSPCADQVCLLLICGVDRMMMRTRTMKTRTRRTKTRETTRKGRRKERKTRTKTVMRTTTARTRKRATRRATTKAMKLTKAKTTKASRPSKMPHLASASCLLPNTHAFSAARCWQRWHPCRSCNATCSHTWMSMDMLRPLLCPWLPWVTSQVSTMHALLTWHCCQSPFDRIRPTDASWTR